MIFQLLVVFQIKHFVCDYLLQTSYMLGKFRAEGWIKPLLAHCAVHAVGTFAITLYAVWSIEGPFSLVAPFALAITDLMLHFIVDRLKADPNFGGRWYNDQREYWWVLGADQMAHHLINYAFLTVLV